MYLHEARAFVADNPLGRFEQGELFEPVLKPRFNVAPLQPLLSIRSDPGGPTYEVVRWGLVPSWSKSQEHAAKLINARSETILEKPSFRQLMGRRRCLIPADGFYEWKKDPSDSRGGTKQPHAIYRADRTTFCFAGLWDEWFDPLTRQPLRTATVCTCEPNKLLRTLHHRMAVILPREHWEAWLDTEQVDGNAAADLLRPLPAEELMTHPVSMRVGKVQNDDPSLVEPVEVMPTSLFG
jgi:putative SOS response-associated peptidase YedK